MHLRREARAALAAVVVLAGAPALLGAAPAAVAAKPDRAGLCTILGTSGDDVLVGTGGDDVICGFRGDDKLVGRGGDDVLRGGLGDDVLRGGPGDDFLSGAGGDDRGLGQAGDDVVRGDRGDDEVVGGPGNDRLSGFRGVDVVRGEGDPGGFVDRVRCGPGPDEVSADPADVVAGDCEAVLQNDPPTGLSLTPSSVAENEPAGTLVGVLSVSDPDPGDSHSFALVAGAGSTDNALVQVEGDRLETAGVFDHESDASLSVRVRATDGAGESTERALTVTVSDANDAPTAVDDDAAGTEDTQVDLPVTGAGSPVVNDTDQDGDTLTVSAVSDPAGGTVSISGGQVEFDPAGNLCGNDAASFTYTVSDSQGGTDTGTVTLDLTCVQDDPTAVDDDRTVAEDSAATPFDVRVNDTDPESDPITVTGVSDPANGTTSFTATNVSYTPDADYCNTPPPYDTFTYTVNGGDTATVRVTVTCANDAPVALDDDRTTPEDTPFSDPVTGAGSPAANDDDVDGDTLTVTAVSDPTGGTVAIVSGDITFTPTADLCGTDAGGYDYTVSDGNGGTDTGAVTIDLTCDNDAPVANDDIRTVAEDSGTTAFGTLLGNDTDAESDPITITGVSDPANGSTSFSATVVDYIPDADHCGSDSFTYTVNGGDTATVSVTVTCVNDAPDVDLDTSSGGNGSTATFTETDPHTGTGVLVAPDAEVTDVDDTQLESATVTLTNRPDGDADESLSFTAPAGSGIIGSYTAATGVLALSGAASVADYEAAIASVRYDNTASPPTETDRTITVVVNDGDDDSTSRTATVTVEALNAPPVNTVPGDQAIDEDTTLTFTGGTAISVADADNTNLDVEVTVTGGTFTLSGTAGLIVTGDGTASVTLSGAKSELNTALDGSAYEPDANSNGPAQLTIVTSDGSDSDTDTVDITVTAVNDAPSADDETFDGAKRAIGNTSLVVDDPTDGAPDPAGVQKTVSGDILDGDTDVDTPLANLTVLAETKATTGGGSVTIEADGDFTYLGEQGCADATDSFTYTLQDNDPTDPQTDAGTVNLTQADCVWYFDASVSVEPPAATGGTSQLPYKALLPISGPGGAGDEDAANDRLFFAPGIYAGGLSLETGQQAMSHRHGLSVPDGGSGTTVLQAANGGAGSSEIYGGTSLATNNNLQGLDFGVNGGSSFSVFGTSVGTATINTVTSGAINNPTGGAIRIDGTGNTVNAKLSTLTAGGGANGILLTNVNGAIEAPAGSLTGSTGAPVSITGGSADVTYGGTITKDTGQLVVIASTTGGTKDFNGAVSDGPTANDGGGISLTGNTGGTIRFDGGLVASTGVNPAFAATGGGTVVVTGSANTLTTTTGTALNLANTTIGADDLTFRSIASNGAASGIVLNNTGSSGGLTVTGNGSACTSAGSCTGGAIQASTGDGVSLTSVAGGTSLTRMFVGGGGDDGIDVAGSAGLTVDASTVVNNGNAADEEGISLAGVTGAIAITGTTVTGSAYNNLRLENSSGTISSLTVSGSKFNNNSAVTGNHGALIDIGGTATMTTASLTGNEFRDNFSIGLQALANSSATINAFTVSGNTFTGTSTGATTGTQEIAVDVSKAGTSSFTFAVSNNTGIVGHNSHGINVFSAAGPGTGGQLRGRVENNTIGNGAVAASGSQIGNCVRVNLNGDSADTVQVSGNVVRQCPNGRGIEVVGRNGTGLKDVTITGNDANTNDLSGFPLAAIFVQSNCVTVCATLRTDIRNNTVPSGTSFDLGGSGFLQMLEPAGGSTLQLVDTAPASADCAAQLASTNTGSTSASAGCALIPGPIGTPP